MSGGSPGAAGLDWAGIMRLGLGALRLAPETFWAMTPLEFERALEGAGLLGPSAPRPFTRARLDELLARFPDIEERE